jgi:6-pyruvoyltetrahydropterin/6-carboxytetrahydropterin synthase
LFGACAAPAPHGHDYTCDVTIAGPIDPQTGMVIDLGMLDRVLQAQVVGPFHGRSLNDAAEFQPGGLIPTCEEVARLIAYRVGMALTEANVHAARVHRVRVAEDDTLSADWTEPA